MSDTAKINVASGFSGGLSVSLRADTAAEFEALLADVQQSPTLSSLLVNAGLAVTAQQGVQNVQAAFPAASPVSTVGQPLPQPGIPSAPAAPAAQPASAPPTVPYPGDCVHGRRVYKDTIARGNPWRRWECAVPWSKDATGRCKPENV